MIPFALRWAGFLLMIASAQAFAHAPGNSYLGMDLTGDRVSARWDIALRDLEYAIGIDVDHDGAITWGEVLAAGPALDQYALRHLRLSVDGDACALSVSQRRISRHADGAYLALDLAGDCGPKGELAIEYSLMFDLDRQHRGLLSVTDADGVENAVLGPEARSFVRSDNSAGGTREFLQFLREGVWHIWIGFDHVLFLLCLLMPAVLQREGLRWRPRESLKGVLGRVAAVVTAFTVAHSLTLGLAAYGWVTLPTALVEVAIAASIVVVAINNIRPLFRADLAFVAFGFGLVHGLGFASVLQGLSAGAGSTLVALAGFNVGIELGQLAIVSAWIPIAYWLRDTTAYRQVVMKAGSWVIAAIAAAWFLERSLGSVIAMALAAGYQAMP